MEVEVEVTAAVVVVEEEVTAVIMSLSLCILQWEEEVVVTAVIILFSLCILWWEVVVAVNIGSGGWSQCIDGGWWWLAWLALSPLTMLLVEVPVVVST